MDLPSFSLPSIQDNEFGWGPSDIPNQFKDIPFAPFNKNDRLGKISDWTAQGQKNQRGGRFPQQFGFGAGTFQYKHEDDESSFSLVDNRPKPKNRFRPKPFVRRPQNNWQNNRFRNNRGRGGKPWQNQGRKRWGYNNYDNREMVRDASVEVDESWPLVATFDFQELNDASGYRPAPPKNLILAGALEVYNGAFDRTTPKNTTPLQRFENRQHFTVSTSNDPVIQNLVKEGAGNVYATDTILGILMAATRSVNSWDLIIKKENGNIFIDKRVNSRIDFLSVNENWNEPSSNGEKDSINTPKSLAREATLINHNFSQQVLSKEESIKYDQPNPFADSVEKGHEPASVAYKYRRWEFEDIRLVARCAINGICKRKGENVELVVRALNEFDSKLSGNVDWRQKLETQTGSVLATEMKNNTNKIARWTAETVLSGADEFRLGFVSRVNNRDSFRHSILLVKRYDPKTFAQSVNIQIPHLWGVLRHILTAIQGLDDATYLLLKDPNKTELQLYSIPPDAFDDEADGGDEGDDY